MSFYRSQLIKNQMLLTKIFEMQTNKKNYFHLFYWLFFINIDITLTAEAIKVYFKETSDDFFKTFKGEKGIYKVTLLDIPEIKKIDYDAFLHIRVDFIKVIKAKNYLLKNFYEVFCFGLLLFNDKDHENYQKAKQSNIVKEKEDYFKDQLKDFFKDIFPKKIKNDAYLHGKKHSDTILFDSEDVKDLVFIEYAANIFLGHPKDSDTTFTIFGHLNRMIDVYSTRKIEFFRHDRLKKKTGNVVNEKAWFIYFGEIDETLMTNIAIKKYESLNVILVDYDFDSDHPLTTYFKKYDEKDFKKKVLQPKSKK